MSFTKTPTWRQRMEYLTQSMSMSDDTARFETLRKRVATALFYSRTCDEAGGPAASGDREHRGNGRRQRNARAVPRWDSRQYERGRRLAQHSRILNTAYQMTMNVTSDEERRRNKSMSQPGQPRLARATTGDGGGDHNGKEGSLLWRRHYPIAGRRSLDAASRVPKYEKYENAGYGMDEYKGMRRGNPKREVLKAKC
ncbi:hypothetical protein PLEOSDRAFT_164092 [Pleurotus ostreatus PC15]|uniref:Uncharacterized protein n=1 Tax=Pleurotus ostreatus (strain PC15) TaxID=1137138 RepID=A0A067PDK1_PLEO1|nr:hypothetical protein PLEOSDRAFT_164092 [Pleurotus ostreatus PC15]